MTYYHVKIYYFISVQHYDTNAMTWAKKKNFLKKIDLIDLFLKLGHSLLFNVFCA